MLNIGKEVLGALVPPVVGAVPVDDVVSEVDVDALLARIDVDALLARIDVDALLARIDVDALLDRIDVDALLARIDPGPLMEKVDVGALVERVDANALIGDVDLDALLQRVDLDTVLAGIDMDALLARIDPDQLMGRIDIDAVLERVDVAGLAHRAGIDQIVADAATGAGTRLLGLVRRQLVALDMIVVGIVSRLFRRPAPPVPESHSPSGIVAGPITRLAAFLVDFGVVSVAYSLSISVIAFLAGLFLNREVNPSRSGNGGIWFGGFVLFFLLYLLIGLTISGNSVGKALVGLRVQRHDHRPVRGWQAVVRVVCYPFSFVLGLGFVPMVLGKRREAFHDQMAGTDVRYDWGDLAIEDRSPLTRWIRQKAPTEWTTAETRPGVPPPAAGSPTTATGASADAATTPPPVVAGNGSGPTAVPGSDRPTPH